MSFGPPHLNFAPRWGTHSPHPSLGPVEKWCCSQTFQNKRHRKGPWWLISRWGSFRRCGKCGPEYPGLDSKLGQICEESQPSYRLQTPNSSAKECSWKAASKSPSPTHLQFSTGRLGQWAVCLLGIGWEKLERLLSPKGHRRWLSVEWSILWLLN